MIHPQKMIAEAPPPVVMTPGLHKRTGLWGLARGVVFPVVLFDRQAEGMPGAEALLFHEGLHVHEKHALAGGMLVGIGIALAAVGVAWEVWPLALASLLTPAVWAWWRREAEARADAFALRGAGSIDFRAFVAMHPHPIGRFWRWVYGRTAAQRIERAVMRAARNGWEVGP